MKCWNGVENDLFYMSDFEKGCRYLQYGTCRFYLPLSRHMFHERNMNILKIMENSAVPSTMLEIIHRFTFQVFVVKVVCHEGMVKDLLLLA